MKYLEQVQYIGRHHAKMKLTLQRFIEKVRSNFSDVVGVRSHSILFIMAATLTHQSIYAQSEKKYEASAEQVKTYLANKDATKILLEIESKEGISSSSVNADQFALEHLLQCQKTYKTACKLRFLGNVDLNDVRKKEKSKLADRLNSMELKNSAHREIEDFDYHIDDDEGLLVDIVGHHQDTPKQIKRLQRIDTEEVIEKLKSNTATLLSVLGGSVTATGLPNSKLSSPVEAYSSKPEANEAIRKMMAPIVKKLLPDLNAEIIVYCMGPQCWASVIMAAHLQDMGYTKVRWYRGGLQAWQAANLPLETNVIDAVFRLN